ncbi:MAG TPA: DUF3616 domain-containing protein [Geminicoccaceae bacterium]|nr:DUF3616 domain-containing protein [Geminicoccaceae bacterium]
MRELAESVRTVLLDLPPKGGPHRKAPRESISALALREDSLFLGSDEGIVLDRLTRTGDDRFASPRAFPILDLLDLPNRTGEDDEIDIEGMDIEGDVLWLVGSHTWTRGKPEDDPPRDLEKVRPNPNRHVLACLPLLPDGKGLYALPEGGERAPGIARLPIGKKQGELAKALKRDAHLGPFRKIPSKENGFDVEGIAARGSRLLLGLRGPVLRGVAIVLELAAEPKTDGELALHPLGPDDRCYRKHFLDLGGNGVRDLHRHGDDLLILAGPTASIDGRCSIWRWRDAWGEKADSFTGVGGRLQQLIRIPVGVDADHPEGIHVLPGTDGREVMVVYDAPAKSRREGKGAVRADVFTLPPR